MKNQRKYQAMRIGKIAAAALVLALAAVLFAIPAFAEGNGADTTAPFWFTPIGMTAIILAVAIVVVAIVCLVRAANARKRNEKPTVIPLEPNLPEMRTQENEPTTFAEAVEKYAKEEHKKEDAAQKREVNRAINEVLHEIRLADWRETHANAQQTESVPHAVETFEQKPQNDEIRTVNAETAVVADPDISRELADRVEMRTERKTDADSVTEPDVKSVLAEAYRTAFEEAKNISADSSDAIELTEDTEDITPAVTAELETELEQSEQPLAVDETGAVDEVVADIRDSVLADDEEPIELAEEDVESPTLKTEPEETESAVAETLEEAIAVPVEEPSAAAYADLTEEEEPEDESEEENEESDDEEDENAAAAEDGPVPAGGQRIVYIDAKAAPEAYAELLEREKRGEITLVYRYRKSFLAKMSMAQDTVKTYYNEVKNALLAYKGVKCRTSWGYEAFNKGRAKLARLDVKTKSLYLYLAIDPQSLADTKYTFKDMSEKKKYAATPVLMKIRGERKFKHALELIEKICGEELQLKRLETEPVDFRLPMMSQDEMVEAGYMKMMVGAVPLVPETVEPEPESVEQTEVVETAAESTETVEIAETAETAEATEAAE